MTSALFLGSALMLAFDVPPLMFPTIEAARSALDSSVTLAPSPHSGRGFQNVSMLGLTGVIVSIMMGLRLLWSIRKSGNLDQAE